jgi:hypothetical protein
VPPYFLYTIEQTAFSGWVRDSPSIFGFWFIISCHAIGMALLVGASAVIELRILGVARDLPLSMLKRLYPIIWAGFWIQVVSGAVLLIGYPTKSLMAPAFYVKIAFIAAAMVVMVRMDKRLPSADAGTPLLHQLKPLAVWSAALWLGAISAGRLIAYTAKYITYP